MGKPTGALRATRLDRVRRTNVCLQGTPETQAAGRNHGTGTCARQQRPPRARNPDQAHNRRTTRAQEVAPGNTQPGEGHPPLRNSAAHTERSAGKAACRVGQVGPNYRTKEPREAHEGEEGVTTMGGQSGIKRNKSSPHAEEQLGQ